MSISHGGYSFESITTHGDVIAQSPHELRDHRIHFFAVQGESEIRDETGGRDLVCMATMIQYASAQALKTAFDTIQANANQLTGTLTVTGTIAQTFADCTFKGAVMDRKMRDAVDGNWLAAIKLFWRQHG